MRSLLLSLALCVAAVPLHALEMNFAPSIPTTLGSDEVQPRSTRHFDGTSYGPGLTPLTIPCDDPTSEACGVAIDALALDSSGKWLFSVDIPSDLGVTRVTYQPDEIVRYDGSGGYTHFLQRGSALGLTAANNIDALLRLDDDRIVVSFDSPTTIGVLGFDQGDLVELERPVGALPDAWTLAATNPYFDASAAGVPAERNLIGADLCGGSVLLLTFDVAHDATPPSLFLPGSIVAWDGSSLSLLYRDPAWPVASAIGDFVLARSGAVQNHLRAVKSSNDVQLSWAMAVTRPATAGAFKTRSKRELLETAAGIGDETRVGTTSGVSIPDPGAVPGAGGDIWYYKVLPVDGCGQAF